jgi:hypothetical protein
MNSNYHHETDSDAIDRVLAGEQVLVPSSGFVAAVMERVREEAATPAPIPFPWKLAMPGIVLAAGALGWSAYETMRSVLAGTQQFVFSPPQLSTAAVLSLEDAGWVALALAASLASWLLSRQLAGRRGLL